ncbi:MAG: glycosyltransferase family 2 protein [Phycisphaerales bacterium JB063]
MPPTRLSPIANQEPPTLSVVVPARDEVDNVARLVEEVDQALAQGDSAGRYELIVVNDGSRDGTQSALESLADATPWLRIMTLERPAGQSAALFAGIAAARGAWTATLDADLQNDPADLPAMLRRAIDENLDLVQGDRSANRRDNIVRRVGSWVGRVTRRLLLNDKVSDTGCSARIMRTALAKQLPLDRAGMHRFIPALLAMRDARIAEHPVNHRPRTAGQTKYGLGILKRALPGLRDTFAVRRMAKQWRAQPDGRHTPYAEQEGGRA